MINRVVIKWNSVFTQKFYKYFSTTVNGDPYYILGVDKTADFLSIKKAFYKLASHYHPDKTAENQQSSIKFMLIKQAYETIKMQKGLLKPASFIYDTDVKSMRPQPMRFEVDDEETRKNQADYKMFNEKAEADGEKYEYFKGTFKTLNDINDIKIKVEKGQIKDAMKRFNLESVRERIKAFSENSAITYVIIIVAVSVFFVNINQFYNSSTKLQLQTSLQDQQKKLNKRRIFDQEQLKKQKIIQQLQKDEKVKKYLKQTEINKGLNRKEQIASGEKSL